MGGDITVSDEIQILEKKSLRPHIIPKTKGLEESPVKIQYSWFFCNIISALPYLHMSLTQTVKLT